MQVAHTCTSKSEPQLMLQSLLHFQYQVRIAICDRGHGAFLCQVLFIAFVHVVPNVLLTCPTFYVYFYSV